MSKSGWGQRLREARGNFRQDIFAEMVGVSRSVWADYEKEIGLPRIDTLIRVAELSKKSVNWLATGIVLPVERQAVLDLAVLADVIETALMSAEAVRAAGKVHTPEQIAAHAKALYEIAIKERVDRIISPIENALAERLEGITNDAGNEIRDHEVHRVRRAGK